MPQRLIRSGRLRWIDRWLGAPLCAVASLARRLAAARPAPAGPPRQILFIGLAEMGAVVLADPAIRRAAAPAGREAHFLVFAHNRASLGLTGSIAPQRIFALRADSLLNAAADLVAFRRWCRRRAIDTVVDLEPCSRFSALLAWASGAVRRSGFEWPRGAGPYRGRLYTHPVAYADEQHIATNFERLVDALGDAPPVAPTAAVPPAGAAARAAALRRLVQAVPAFQAPRHALVLLHANVSDPVPQRRWPAARWADLARTLLRRHPELVLVLIGGPDERAPARALAAAVGDPRCASLAGELELAGLPALFAASRLLVSSDSGPAHFAAAAGLPVVALFGPETPRRYGPVGPATLLYAGIACSPCLTPARHRHTRCRDNRCMQAIGLEVVAEAVSRQLEGVAGAGVAPPTQILRRLPGRERAA